MIKKNKQLNIRITENAKNIIVSNAEKLEMSQSDYFEMLATRGIIEMIEINNPTLNNNIEHIIKVFDALGNNINQIAKKINAGGNFSDGNIKQIKIANENFKTLYKTLNNNIEKKIIFKNED